MKKIFIIFVIISTIFIFFTKISHNKEDIPVMSVMHDYNNYYELNFKNDNLNFRNFKLKIGIFTSFEYNIMKIYIQYPDNIKEYFEEKPYFSFDSTNLNLGIEKLKYEYKKLLQSKFLYDEIENIFAQTRIYKIELYSNEDAIEKFKRKYPNVDIIKKR